MMQPLSLRSWAGAVLAFVLATAIALFAALLAVDKLAAPDVRHPPSKHFRPARESDATTTVSDERRAGVPRMDAVSFSEAAGAAIESDPDAEENREAGERAELRGIVVDEFQRPVAGAAIAWHGLPLDRDEWTVSLAETWTNDDGRYEIDVDPCRRYVLGAHSGAGIGQLAGEAIGPGSEMELAPIVLGPGLAIEGAVVFPDGSPVAEAVIDADFLPIEGSPEPQSDPWDQEGRPVGALSAGAITGADGRFRIAGLRAGRFELRFLERADAPPVVAEAGSRDLRIVADWHRLGVDVRGSGAADLRMIAVFEPGDVAHALQRRERRDGGTLWFERRPDRAYRVLVSGPVSAARLVAASDARVLRIEITMPELSAARRLRLRIDGADDFPAEGFAGCLLWPESRGYAAGLRLSPTGWTEDPLPAGDFVLEVRPESSFQSERAPFLLPAQLSVRIPESGTLEVVVGIPRGGRFAISPAAAGEPGARAAVRPEFRRVDPPEPWRAFYADDALMRCGNDRRSDPVSFGERKVHQYSLEPGRYEARFEGSGFEPTIVPFEIHAGEVTEVRAMLALSK